MSFFEKILGKVLHPTRHPSPFGGGEAKAKPAAQPQAQPQAKPQGQAQARPQSQPQPQPQQPRAQSQPQTQAQAALRPEPVDVEQVLTQMATQKAEPLNWRESIVDLLKLLDLDSSLAARKELAQELGYQGALNGSAEMNIWLHKQVMRKLAENGGKVPASLQD